MDHLQSTENARPWWADVAHLRDDSDHLASVQAPTSEPDAGLITDRRQRDRPAPVRADRPELARDDRTAPGRELSGRSRSRKAERPRTDWFAQDARAAGRRRSAKPTVDPTRPVRPRATLVDVAPQHALVRRAPQVRRAPGERPTVTITGRPDAALPPAVREPQAIRARRTRERATSLVASPDRMMLWAVALGLLMILASIGTSADAHSLLP